MKSRLHQTLKERVDAWEQGLQRAVQAAHEEASHASDTLFESGGLPDGLEDDMAAVERSADDALSTDDASNVQHLQRLFEDLEAELRALIRETRREAPEDSPLEEMDTTKAFKWLFGRDS